MFRSFRWLAASCAGTSPPRRGRPSRTSSEAIRRTQRDEVRGHPTRSGKDALVPLHGSMLRPHPGDLGVLSLCSWTRRSTARPPGPTRTASQAGSRTRATTTRPGSPARRRSAGSTAAGRFSSRPGMGAVTTVLLTMLRPGQTIAIAEAAYYGHAQLCRPPRALGRRVRRVRPERAAAAGRRPRADRGAGEPRPDDAGLRGRRRAPGAGRLRCDGRLAAACAPAGARLRRRPALGHEGARRARRRARRRRHGERDDDLYERLHLMRRRTGIVAAPDAAWLLHRGLRTLAVRFERQEQTARLLAERLARTRRSRSSATRASRSSSRSTSPTATRRAASSAPFA